MGDSVQFTGHVSIDQASREHSSNISVICREYYRQALDESQVLAKGTSGLNRSESPLASNTARLLFRREGGKSPASVTRMSACTQYAQPPSRNRERQACMLQRRSSAWFANVGMPDVARLATKDLERICIMYNITCFGRQSIGLFNFEGAIKPL